MAASDISPACRQPPFDVITVAGNGNIRASILRPFRSIIYAKVANAVCEIFPPENSMLLRLISGTSNVDRITTCANNLQSAMTSNFFVLANLRGCSGRSFSKEI